MVYSWTDAGLLACDGEHHSECKYQNIVLGRVGEKSSQTAASVVMDANVVLPNAFFVICMYFLGVIVILRFYRGTIGFGFISGNFASLPTHP